MNIAPLSADELARCSAALASALPESPSRARRIEQYYLPVFAWIHARVREHTGTVIVGINGPQGAGKSTLVRHLVPLFEHIGVNAVAISIDDFYLTHAEQRAIATRHARNPYLQHRGYPGTHDVALGGATLRALVDARSGDTVALPSYDKSAHRGAGDRVPRAQWRSCLGPVNVVILEGWMLGFAPVPRERIDDDALAEVNEKLAAYAPWNHALDAMVQLRMTHDRQVVNWRIEAERTMRAQGRDGMTDDETRDYVETFLPAYAIYPAALEDGPPTPGRHLVIRLDDDRLPVSEHSGHR